MAKSRYWQARVTYPGGGIMTFGVKASSEEAAAEKAGRIAAVPGRDPGQLEITRLYGKHHPLRKTEGRYAGAPSWRQAVPSGTQSVPPEDGAA